MQGESSDGQLVDERKMQVEIAVRLYLDAQQAEPDLLARAALLEEVVRQFYDHAKFRAPGGEGLDGHDGPERRAIGLVVDAARTWADDLRAERRRTLTREAR